MLRFQHGSFWFSLHRFMCYVCGDVVGRCGRVVVVDGVKTKKQTIKKPDKKDHVTETTNSYIRSRDSRGSCSYELWLNAMMNKDPNVSE